MRKVKLLLAAVLTMTATTGTMAQVTGNADLSNDKVYTVTTARGAWMVDQTNNRMSYNDSYTTASATPTNDVIYQFAFINYGGHYYLYAPAVKKFVQPQKYFVNGYSTPITLAVENGNVKVKAENSNLTMNIGGSQWTWDTWTAYDDGNKVTIVEAADFSAADLSEAITILTGATHFDPHKVYTVACERVGNWAVSADHNSLSSTLAYSGATDAEKQFAFYYDEGKLYIYSVGAGKFLNGDGSLATGTLGTPMDYRIIGTSGYDHMLFVPGQGGDDKYFNSQTSGGYSINTWSSADAGNKQQMVEVAGVDVYDAMNAIVHPSYFVTYVVKDAANNTLFTSEPLATTLGTTITTLPSEYQRSFYTYNEVNVTVSQQTTTAEFTATWNGPFEISADFDNAHWYNMAVRGSYYVTTDNPKEDGALAPVLANAIGLVENSYQWAFVGNGYAGFKLFNKGKGAAQTYAWESNDNGSIPTFVDVATSKTWYIKASTSSVSGAFMLTTDKGYQVNQFGGASGSLKVWTSTGTSDAGSAFTVFDVPSNFAQFVNDEISPYFESTAKYFVFTDAAKAQINYDPAYKTDCPYATYKGMKEVMTEAFLSNLTNYVLPETGYYLLKNKNYGTYMGIDPSDANMYGNYAAANAAKHIVKLTKNADNTYTIGLMGKFAPATVAQSNPVTASTEAGTYTPVISTVGYAAFKADMNARYSCLHTRAEGDIVGWESPADASLWEAIDAEGTEIELTIGDEGYATTYLPFHVAIPNGVTAYTAEITENPGHNDFLTMNPLSATIPELTAVVLKAAPATYKFMIGEGVAVPDGALGVYNEEVDGSEALVKSYAPEVENVLKGTLAPIDAVGKYILAKPDGEDVGFYQAESGTIAAGKAYLEVPAGSDVKAFYFLFPGDDATGINEVNGQWSMANGQSIYNVAGQLLNKMQKGINIVNGKKILK